MPLHESLQQLATLQQARVERDTSIAVLAKDVVARGASRGDVGRTLGLTRQGARQEVAPRL